MKQQANRWIAFGLMGAMAATTFGGIGTTAAYASPEGRRNTTIGLGAVTAYGLLKKKKTVAVAGAVGTAVAYRQYRIAKKRQKRQSYSREARRRAWYQRRYGSNWRQHYRPGV